MGVAANPAVLGHLWHCRHYGRADPATGIYHPGVGPEADPAPPAPVDGLGRVCKRLQPEQDHADVDHSEVVVATLLIAGGDAPCLLEAVDQPLDFVAQAVGFPVEVALARLILPGRDYRADVA